MRVRTWFAGAAALVALAGCVGAPLPVRQGPTRSVFGPRVPPGVVAPRAVDQAAVAPGGGALSHVAPAGRMVALLAPLSGVNAERGQALAAAARLALAEPGAPPLEVFDTHSTAEGAGSAVRQAITGGAGLIIGPLTAGETAAVAAPAQQAGLPVLAFTNDSTQARPGVWTLGLTPGQQMRRFVASLVAKDKTRFAAVLPSDGFGQAMATALGEAVAEAGLAPPSIHYHTGTTASVNQVMREASGYAARRGPLDAALRAASAEHTPEGRKRAADLRRQPVPPPPMDALLLADFGDMLGTLASLLSYYDIETSRVRVLGPAQWAAPQVATTAELRGAWYAAPDPALRADFSARYAAQTGAPAPGLADFAYDAAGIARALLLSGEGYSMAALCRGEGFAGVNGVLGLLPDGRVRRGLAVFQLGRGGATMVETAPATLAEPGT